MLFKFKKKEEKTITHYLSFMFYPDEKIVCFNTIFQMMNQYNLTVNNMTFRSNEHLVDDRHMVTFGVTGTSENLEYFEEAVLASTDEYLNKTFKERI